jgi:hypothetical protein
MKRLRFSLLSCCNLIAVLQSICFDSSCLMSNRKGLSDEQAKDGQVEQVSVTYIADMTVKMRRGMREVSPAQKHRGKGVIESETRY